MMRKEKYHTATASNLSTPLVCLQNRKSKALKSVDFFDVFRDTIPEMAIKLPTFTVKEVF